MMSIVKRWGLMFMMGALLMASPVAWAQYTGGEMMTLDQEYAEIAEKVPGFGGLYLDEAGSTHVYLQDVSLAREVQYLGEHVVVHQGDYDFRDLVAWKESLRELLRERGAVFLDVDERRNRIVFGVEAEWADGFSTALGSFLRSVRVPAAAVAVETAEPALRTELLTDRIRPVPGGVQTSATGGTCTVGVNAFRLGVRGFVTASHCTNVQGGVEGTDFYQNVVSWPWNLVGTEAADPNYYTGGDCPSGYKCRSSDSAFVAYTSSSLSGGGVIANPFLCGWLAGPLATDSVQPRTPLTGFLYSTPASGTLLRKVGRTTGCTFGSVINTCTDVVAAGTNIMLLCQSRVAAGAKPGDSGSPVFRQHSEGGTLAGILWGGSTANDKFWYSPWLSVHLELGGVTPELE